MAQPKIEMYTKAFCPFCVRAKGLLKGKGMKFIDIPAAMNREKRAEMNKRSGRNTFPQIFIDGQHIGGCDDIFALERSGKLDGLLGL
ncbi:MAG: glutaredoxin 3 [Maricaulaceae bacterium]